MFNVYETLAEPERREWTTRLSEETSPVPAPHNDTATREVDKKPEQQSSLFWRGEQNNPRHQNNARQVKGRSLRTCPSFPNIGCCCLYKLDNVCPRVPPPASSHSSPPTPSQTRWTRTRVKNHAGPQFRGAFAEEPRYDGCIGHPAGRAECGWRFCSGVGSLIDADFAEGLTDMYV